MTASISPLAQALKLFRVELGQARSVGVNRQTGGAAGAAARNAVAQQVPVNALQALRTQVRAARGSDGKLPPGKALRIFVQAALLDELGSGLQLDPALGDLVERTCLAIEQDNGNASLLADALRELEAMAD